MAQRQIITKRKRPPIGHPSLKAVEIEDLNSDKRQIVGCDSGIPTGDWICDHELARLTDIDVDPQTTGPRVNSADIAAIDGVQRSHSYFGMARQRRSAS